MGDTQPPSIDHPVQRPLILTMGEPSGVGPDLIAEVLKARPTNTLPPIVVTGDHHVLAQRFDALGVDPGGLVPVADFANIENLLADGSRVAVLQTEACATPVQPGAPDPANAASVISAIDTAVTLVRDRQASGLVTNPIQKETLYAAGFSFPGHTEYLAALGEDLFNIASHPVMLIHTPQLCTVPVTIHIPLAEVAGALTTELIVRTCRITARDLTTRLGIAAPRLAVAGLNPHAGEGGQIGTEDRDIVAPAIAILRAEGIQARGPLPADTMFHAAARESYDVAVCMYHDQALIPAKTLGFDVGVNTTLGLPFVRTSPDHGTALDIAGSGRAKPDSLFEALKLAAQMARNSAEHGFAAEAKARHEVA
jgi:4-hydroxythreonine-4-phosphate dehydrogenase